MELDDYLRQAEYCVTMADTAHTEDLKGRWLSLSQRWLAMANAPSSVNIMRSEFAPRPASMGEQLRRA